MSYFIFLIHYSNTERTSKYEKEILRLTINVKNGVSQG